MVSSMADANTAEYTKLAILNVLAEAVIVVDNTLRYSLMTTSCMFRKLGF
jgi:hypothetical protein